MPADLKFKRRADTPVTVLSTGLDGLANNAAVLSAAIAQDTDLDLYGDLELVVTFGTAPTADAAVEVYVVRQIDGTNYEDGSATGPILPKNGAAGAFFVRAVTTAQRMVIPMVVAPPRDHKYMVRNVSGQAFATGNTLKWLPYREQSV